MKSAPWRSLPEYQGFDAFMLQIHSLVLARGLTVMKPSSRPESGLGGAWSLSMDHFSMIEATWLFSVLRILKPVMFTPLYR